MRAELVVRYLLLQSSALLALVPAAAISPGRLPQGTRAGIVVELVSATEILPINAAAGGTMVRSRVQVTAIAETYAALKAVHEQARIALLFKSGLFVFSAPNPVVTVRVIGVTRDLIGPDLRDDDIGVRLQSIDYQVIHDEA